MIRESLTPIICGVVIVGMVVAVGVAIQRRERRSIAGQIAYETAQARARHPEDMIPLPPLSAYLGHYALLAILGALTIVVLFGIWRWTILVLLARFVANVEVSNLLYRLAVFLLGVGGLVLVLSADAYLRGGVEQRQLLRRFARFLLPLLGAGLLGVLVTWALGGI